MNIAYILLKGYGLLLKYIFQFTGYLFTRIILKGNNVNFQQDLKSFGVPIIKTKREGKFTIGTGFKMHNGYSSNLIGRQQRCIFNVTGNLIIGDNVGVSSIAIVCRKNIIIEDGVRIGGNTIIYDTDFHSLNPQERISFPEIIDNVKSKPVIIKENAFIGAHSILLKGTIIGKNSIIGAGSVVTGEVPDSEIWAGNPARFIKTTGINDR